MKSTQFNDGWSVAPKRGLFDGVDGAPAPSEAVTLPHDAMLGFQRSADAPSGSHGAYFPGGAVEYTRELEVSDDGVHTLVFDGVYRDAMVFVNDNFAGQSPSGYSRFAVRLDPFLQSGSVNTIRVEARAHRDSRWYSGLGIHRNVAIVAGPLVHIALDGLRVWTPQVDGSEATVVAETTVANDSLRTATVTVETTLMGPDGTVVGTARTPITLLAGESGAVRERFRIENPALWNLDDPLLYRASVTLSGESETNTDSRDVDAVIFGIRSLQLDPRNGLRINGQSVKLRGACIHHDNGVIGARSIARAEERRIQLLKDAGFNAIRSAHNPLSVELLDACDRLGMLVMDESFDMWAEAKSPFDYSLAFPEWWERDLESMVAKNFNHPSVIFYSIGNEIPETGRAHGSRIGRLLTARLRELDDTRFTTNSINGLVSVIREMPALMADVPPDINNAMTDMGAMMTELVASDLVTRRTEESFASVDAAGMNYGYGRYAADITRFPNRVIVGTESFNTKLDEVWSLVMEHDHVIGDFAWTGWDYLGEAGIGRVDVVGADGGFGGTSGPYPYQLAWCGDLDITGFRRPVSYFREIVWGLRTAPYLAVQRPLPDGLRAAGGPWSWSDTVSSWSWGVERGTPLTVEVYSGAEEVELLLNSASLGSAAPERHRAVFVVGFEPGSLTVVARSGGVETGRHELHSAAGEPLLRVESDRTEIRASSDDLAFVTIDLVDAAGEVLVSADTEITVTVSGPGELLGLGSGRPDTEESYLGSRHRTFEGRLHAVIRPTAPGEIVIAVAADGLEPRTITLDARETREA